MYVQDSYHSIPYESKKLKIIKISNKFEMNT